MFFTTIISMILIKIIGDYFGLIGATVIMLLSFIFVWLIMDNFGDFLFTDSKYRLNQEIIDKYKNKSINFYPGFLRK